MNVRNSEETMAADTTWHISDVSCFVQSTPLLLSSQRHSNRPLVRFMPSHQSQTPCRQRRASIQTTPSACAEATEFSPVSTASILENDSTTSAPYEPKPASISLLRICAGLWPFTRPHTFYGTLLSVSSITTLARKASSSVGALPFFAAYLTALIPALLLNIYIVGLNQFYDVEIDRINKPFLPLPAGIMTKRDAALVIAISLVAGLSFCLAPLATNALRTVLVGSTVLGTIYSAPPFRLKRFALLASIAILSVRGVLVNIGFFMHAAASSGIRALPPLISFATAFFMLFGVVIALLKDAPDIRGDRKFGIRTFSVRLGARAVFNACAVVLVAMFAVAAVFYFHMSASLLGGVLTGAAHVIVAAVLARRAIAVDTESSKEIYKFYMFSWKAFYLEYLLLPIATL